MLRVAICGGSGYTGAELLRILSGHPRVTVTAVTSEQSAGKSPAHLYPHLRGHADLTFEPLRKEKLLKKADIFFMALPHAASQDAVAYFVKKGKQVVDLSADFRLKNPQVYEQWYKTSHRHGAVLEEAVYGLPELHRKEIKKARLVANPGCYPTAALLGLAPLVRAGMAGTGSIVIDAKSGTTGAGRKADVSLSFCEVNEGFRAYGVTTHRHTPEIEQELTALAGEPVAVTFTPHLLPVDRGILCTTYARAAKPVDEDELRRVFVRAYAREPFVEVLGPGELPNVKHVRGGNSCHVAVAYNGRTGTVIVVTVIDNLVKGAAGQAVQCMNLMTGSRETTGLLGPALAP
jgi:N-acetyl-gamma-glutamyl-phosphate reductase